MKTLFALLALSLLSSCGIGAIGAGHCNHEQLRDPHALCTNR